MVRSRVYLNFIHDDNKKTSISMDKGSYNHQVYLDYLKAKEERSPVPAFLKFYIVKEHYNIHEWMERHIEGKEKEKFVTKLEPIEIIRVITETIVRIEETE